VAAATKVVEQARRELHDLLIETERAYRSAARIAEKHRRLRNDVIRAAVQAGVSQTEIAGLVDLSRARIAQILRDGDT
jgi:hypothetical protein